MTLAYFFFFKSKNTPQKYSQKVFKAKTKASKAKAKAST